MWKMAFNQADIFQHFKRWAKCLTMNCFHWTILAMVGTMSSWLKIDKRGGGVAIRMSWYVFFEKINSRGDIYSGPDWRVKSVYLPFVLFEFFGEIKRMIIVPCLSTNLEKINS